MSASLLPAPGPSRAAVPARVLPTLALAQFAGTSPWFAVNAVMPDLQRELGWPAAAVGTLTSALQGGFIAGTLVFALLALADRVAPRRLFLVCSLLSAASSLAGWALVRDFGALAVCRFATGFCLAGIYPVGMKLAAMWFPRGLGPALGLLLGALVMGSAAGHLLRGFGSSLPWSGVMAGVAVLAALAGVGLHALLPEPPATPGGAAGPPPRFDWRALGTLWTDRKVRASAFGYFGHMWELYTMWVLLPLVLATRLQGPALSFAAFAVLGAGAIGCVAGGWWARRVGSATVAGSQLAASGLCCLAAPWLIDAPGWLFAAWLLVWGITVAGDSPQFSALTAANAPRHAVGSVLTLTTSIGFAITIVSIELFVRLSAQLPLSQLLPWLAAGPVLGLLALAPLWRGKV